MALADHWTNTQNIFKALDLDTNYLKPTHANCVPLNPIQDELLKRTEKVLNHLQNLTKSFQNIRNSLVNQFTSANKENSPQEPSQNNFSFEKQSPLFKNSGSTPQQVSKQITETIDSFSEFLKSYCPQTSFEVCLDLCSFQEASLNAGMKSPSVAFRDTSEIKSPTLNFSKFPEKFLARTNIKAKTQTQYSIKVHGCSTSPGHHLKPPSMRGNLFSNLMDFSPAGKLFDDISPIGCFKNTGTFTASYNRLTNPVRRKISEFICEAENAQENDLAKRVGNISGVVNETDYRLKSTVNEAKSDKEMSTEFSIEIEEVKVEVQKPHLDENGNEMLLFGLNQDE